MQRGSYAQYAVVPAWQLVKVPATLGLDLAAAAMLQGMTAHYLTHSTFPLQNGQTCLVHAAAGGAGQLVVQMAKRRGARVIGTVGSAAKAEIAREAGADETILQRAGLGRRNPPPHRRPRRRRRLRLRRRPRLWAHWTACAPAA